MVIVETKDLTIGYGKGRRQKVVLSGLNLQLQSGTVTALLGRNGSGKSTLLRTLTGLQQPLGGEILISGRPLSALSASERAQLIAVVLTDRDADMMLTVGDAVSLGRLPYTNFWGTLTYADRAAIDKAITVMGIDKMRNRMLTTLSDGERQKTMVAKAIAQQASLLVLDEPTAFMDYESKLELMKTLSLLSRERHVAVIISTHDLDIAKRYCDNFIEV